MSNVGIFQFPKDAWDKLKPKEQEALRDAITNIETYPNPEVMQYSYSMQLPPSAYRTRLFLDVSLTYAEMLEDPKDRTIKELRKQLSELESIKSSIAKLKKFTEGI